MTIHENLTEFAGLPVKDFRKPGDVADFARTAPRLRCEYEDKVTLRDFLAQLLDEPGVGAARALVFGAWMENGESYEVSPATTVEMLVAMKERLPAIEALFFGDIISEENEISWIEQGDYSSIWGAFPRLGHFGVRGGNQLSLGTINHHSLHTLVVETGGLPRAVVREALAAKAPIRHFELWLGSDAYGADTSVADFTDLLAGKLFPQLHTLALRNSEYSDAIAEAVATAPVLDRIKVLDLSLGTLTDKGARALIASGRLGKLEKLDISHHYVSPEVTEELRRATPNLVAEDPQEPDEWDGEVHYYIAVSE
jgi:hypothetical protein